MNYSEEQLELMDGISLVLAILEPRLVAEPLTTPELNLIKAYNNACSIHVFPDLTYCKACKGIVVAMSCQTGIAD